MRLNIGSGPANLPGYVNLDINPAHLPDVVGDARHLPFADGSCDEVRAFDVIEHFPHELTQSVLAEWQRVLTPTGVMYLRTPNLAILGSLVYEGDHIIDNIYGGYPQGLENTWDTHKWGWTPASFQMELATAGLQTLSMVLEPNMIFGASRA